MSVTFAANHMQIPFYIVTAYLGFIYLFSKYMNRRSPMSLTKPLIYWNTILCIFSFLGTINTVPLLLRLIHYSNDFKDTICANPVVNWEHNPWVGMFVFSKIPELVDTFFILARKRNLMLLHWYHHVTVLVYCWHSYATESPQTLYFVAMNYSIHTVMYGYYALCALKRKPRWLSPEFVTGAQIMQMVVGIIVQINAAFQYKDNPSCQLNGTNVFWGGIMYTSYFMLFVRFAIFRYKIKHA